MNNASLLGLWIQSVERGAAKLAHRYHNELFGRGIVVQINPARFEWDDHEELSGPGPAGQKIKEAEGKDASPQKSND